MSGSEMSESPVSVSHGGVSVSVSRGFYSIWVRGGGSEVAIRLGRLMTDGLGNTTYEVRAAFHIPKAMHVQVFDGPEYGGRFTMARRSRWSALIAEMEFR